MGERETRDGTRFGGLAVLQIGIAVVGLGGLLWFGWPSPEERPKVYELYLAGVWGLLTLSCVSVYARWSAAPWLRRIFAVAAPLSVLLYLQKYFFG